MRTESGKATAPRARRCVPIENAPALYQVLELAADLEPADLTLLCLEIRQCRQLRACPEKAAALVTLLEGAAELDVHALRGLNVGVRLLRALGLTATPPRKQR
jgi:hypothetical protein